MNKIALIDLECTCNDAPAFSREEHEIIEVGAVIGTLTSGEFLVVGDLQLYVQPTIRKTLTTFCTKLTGIAQRTVDSAAPLEGALRTLESWLQCNDVSQWASWGKFDANQFEIECQLKSIENPMQELKHYNLKQIFARKFGHRVGLQRALTLRGLVFQGKHHSGIDDSKNIGLLVAHEPMLREALLKKITLESI